MLSVIIVTWNVEKELADCLNSLVTHCISGNNEIILIDNASTDDTAKVIHEYSDRYNNIRGIFLNNNIGFAAANNIALRNACGKNVFFLNPDTILLDDSIERMIHQLKSNPSYGAVAPKLLNADRSIQKSTLRFATPANLFFELTKLAYIFPDFIKEKFFPYASKCKKSKTVDWVIGAAVLMRTEEARQIGGFSEDYFMYTEDEDLCMKIKSQLHKNVFYDIECQIIHLCGASERKNYDSVNYNKFKIMTEGLRIFCLKFYGRRCALRCMKVYIFCNYFKYMVFKFLLFINSNDRKAKMCFEKYKVFYESGKQNLSIIEGM